VEVYLHARLTSALNVGEWPASRPRRITPRERHRYPLGRMLEGPRSGLKTVKTKTPYLFRKSNAGAQLLP